MAIDDKIADGTIQQTLEAEIAQLLQYEDELAKLSVPIMFAGDYYALRGHVRYLRLRLEEIKLQRQQSLPEVSGSVLRTMGK